ncbi:MAG: helix-turn-helix domain-containing protein, partial [Chloroflexota bacterium]
MIERSWAGECTMTVAAVLGCHVQSVREWLVRFNAEGVGGLGDRAGGGRPPRLTEADGSVLVGLAQSEPPGKLVRWADGTPAADRPEQDAHWTLDALTSAAQGRGIAVKRSQVRRVLKREGVRWRHTRSWATSTD